MDDDFRQFWAGYEAGERSIATDLTTVLKRLSGSSGGAAILTAVAVVIDSLVRAWPKGDGASA